MKATKNKIPQSLKDADRAIGKISFEDQKFILDNLNVLSIKEIAKSINRNPRTVLEFIKVNNIIMHDPNPKDGVIFDDKYASYSILQDLRKRKIFYKHLKLQLNSAEIKMFEEAWCQIIIQYGSDVLPTEEMQIKEFILYDIQKNRVLFEISEMIADADSLKFQINEFKKLEPDSLSIDDKKDLARLKSELSAATSRLDSLYKQHMELSDKSQKMNKDLSNTRAERTKLNENSKIDFVAMLKLLQEYDVKKRVGREMEMMNLARMKEEIRLSSPYIYANKEADRPILNSDTIGDDDV